VRAADRLDVLDMSAIKLSRDFQITLLIIISGSILFYYFPEICAAVLLFAFGAYGFYFSCDGLRIGKVTGLSGARIVTYTIQDNPIEYYFGIALGFMLGIGFWAIVIYLYVRS